MHKKYNKFLIISSILVSMLGVYSYFYNFKSEAANSDALTSSLDVVPVATPVNVASSKASEDTAFLMKLASLTRIKIDTSLFEDKAFKLLVDNNIKLTPEVYGRDNPFAKTTDRVIVNNTNTPMPLLKTSTATAVTSKSAVLNGSLENAISNNIYFEYGITPTFGKVTQKVIISSVGNFAANVTGLTPKTTYFYHSVANINGTLTYGDTISFNTN